MRAGCILPLVTIALLWAGGQGVYTAVTNRQPVRLSYDEYIATKPKASWLELTDCVVAVPEAAVKKGKVAKISKEAFIPLHSPNAKDDKVHVLVATSAPETLELLRQLEAAPNDAEAIELLVQRKDALYAKRTVKGLVRFGIEMKDEDREKLASLDKNLVEDFVVLDEGKKPEMGLNLSLMGIGLLFGVLWIRSGSKSAPPSSSGPTPPPLPPQPAP